NTLNNLYGMARKQEKATADGIARLSHLMRYMIHDSKVDRINLDKE
ncbi:MAG: sensor histidine kinase, partial [Candidatus Aenigmarchaeota archaeon]|nr:sensor histidine kinase [Candidatus Aenigmarchaeota archaeon]